jgi:uncharacterized repeat protein (TIGR02543 family)
VEVQITITTNPTGLSFTVDGTSYSSAQTFTWVENSTYTIAVSSPQSGCTGMQYVYTSWSDGGAQSHTYTVPGTNQTVTANFDTQFYLTTSVNPAGYGEVTPAPPGEWCVCNSVKTVEATANTGYEFTGWSGDLTGSTNPATITMDTPKNIQANFQIESGVIDPETPLAFQLLQNYPNPFNPETTIKYTLPIQTHVDMIVFSIAGKKVKTLVNSNVDAGVYHIKWNGCDGSGNPVSAGIYLCRIQAGKYTHTIHMLLLK